MWLYHRVVHPKGAQGMVNNVDSVPPICDHTVFPDISVQNLSIITGILLKADTFVMFFFELSYVNSTKDFK